MTTRNSKSNVWSLLVSIGTFLLYALTYAAPSGYSYGAALLLLTSLGYLTTRPRWQITAEDKAIACSFLCIFIVSAIIFFIHGNELKTLDQTSRYVLLVPILMLLLNTPPSLRILWAGIAAGSISAGIVAAWQRHWLELYRPDGFMTSAIPFGDISLMGGILCLAGMFWSNSQGRSVRIWQAALAMGFLAGVYASFLSGSRGGWLAIPATLTLFFIAFLTKKNLRQALLCLLLLVASISLIFLALRGEIMNRYDIAVLEVNQYAQHREADTSVGIRLEAWRAAIMNISEKPILGWSYQDYNARLYELAEEKKADISITSLANIHNNYLEAWVHQGIFGLLALLAMFIVPFWFFCKRLRSPNIKVQSLAVGGASLLVSFFIFGLTQVILGRNNGNALLA